MFNILFVCMGNICRSPSAEGFFAHRLKESDYAEMISIDSAGTHSYHIGHPPDPRSIETAVKFGIQIEHLRARKVTKRDFETFDLMIAMDQNNLANLQAIKPRGSTTELELMMTYYPQDQSVDRPDEVPDPYYGGMDGFTHMFELLERATVGLLEEVEGRFS